MIDRLGRKITYLRISVTEQCNLHCGYCRSLNPTNADLRSKLSVNEISNIAEIFVEQGIEKIRLTGGEPLLNRDIVSICSSLSSISGIKKLGITTNGILLHQYASKLKESGIDSVNISLDTLDKDKYAQVTGGGNISKVLDGIEKAIECNFSEVKLNCVLLKGINDDLYSLMSLFDFVKNYPIDIRFIEYMSMKGVLFDNHHFVSNNVVLNLLEEKGCKEIPILDNAHTRLFEIPGYRGRIGLISPLTGKFCSQCNRIRLTADGFIKPCLHSRMEYDIKGKTKLELDKIISEVMHTKPDEHHLEYDISASARSMDSIGG